MTCAVAFNSTACLTCYPGKYFLPENNTCVVSCKIN